MACRSECRISAFLAEAGAIDLQQFNVPVPATPRGTTIMRHKGCCASSGGAGTLTDLGHLRTVKAMNLLASRRNLTLLVAGALAGPYAINETETGQRWWQSTQQMVTGASSSLGANPGGNALHDTEQLWKRGAQADPGMATAMQPTLVGGPVHDLRDVLRFDVNPTWVLQHFSRVTTVLADLQLDGLRVPLVTGTEIDDLAGTLTYYFDRQQQVQRITLHGFTGDPQRLAALMTQHYGMQGQASLGAGTYLSRWNGQATSVLRLEHVPVVHAEATHARYTVFLELNQPSMAFGLSDAATRVVEADRQTLRW